MDSSADPTGLLDPLVVRARQRIGQVLREKWRLDALLGVGGMAAVYSATHRNGSRVAIKILHTELSVNAQVRQRFLREGYVANTVAHDGAVKVADDDAAEDGAAFLVMELLDGETLQGRRERLGGTLSEDEVLFDHASGKFEPAPAPGGGTFGVLELPTRSVPSGSGDDSPNYSLALSSSYSRAGRTISFTNAPTTPRRSSSATYSELAT